jgi:hypothetical protein
MPPAVQNDARLAVKTEEEAEATGKSPGTNADIACRMG